jgi:hypothetical protein
MYRIYTESVAAWRYSGQNDVMGIYCEIVWSPVNIITPKNCKVKLLIIGI